MILISLAVKWKMRYFHVNLTYNQGCEGHGCIKNCTVAEL